MQRKPLAVAVAAALREIPRPAVQFRAPQFSAARPATPPAPLVVRPAQSDGSFPITPEAR